MVRRSIAKLLRNPEYTGDSRCMPCTAVNSVFALAIGMVVSKGLVVLGWSPWLAFAVELFIFAVGGTLILLRGYLFPGTPTLTNRYLPQWIHRWFGKDTHSAGEETDEYAPSAQDTDEATDTDGSNYLP